MSIVFIKLATPDGSFCWVNVNLICSVRPLQNGSALQIDNKEAYVNETPEQVMALIKKAIE